MEPPDSACGRCGKPIRPGTMSQVGGRPVHISCLARDLPGPKSADQARARSAAIVETAAELIAQARGVRDCSVCGLSLAQGAVLFQGDRLVHAVCWQAPSPTTPA